MEFKGMIKGLAYDIILELNAPVAQLDRVTGYEPVGRGFESLLAHQVTCSDWHSTSYKS